MGVAPGQGRGSPSEAKSLLAFLSPKETILRPLRLGEENKEERRRRNHRAKI